MKIKWKTLLICIAIPLIVGGASALISRGSRDAYQLLIKPPLSPPAIVFPIVWTLLFILMGTASYFVLTSEKDEEAVSDAFNLYFLQLIVNFFWSIFFFNLEWYLFSFVWLIFLWILILITIELFSNVSKLAAYLMIPYLLWVTFAGYLNLSIYLLNG